VAPLTVQVQSSNALSQKTWASPAVPSKVSEGARGREILVSVCNTGPVVPRCLSMDGTVHTLCRETPLLCICQPLDGTAWRRVHLKTVGVSVCMSRFTRPCMTPCSVSICNSSKSTSSAAQRPKWSKIDHCSALHSPPTRRELDC
jgi:hypothetical protein